MKLKANKKILGLSLSLVIAAVFLLINPVHAASNWGLDILSGICSAIVGALGWVLVQIMSILVYFAQYNGFITSAAVVNGWVIVRDVCNMFFVLVLLIIAFATILQIEEYNYKKWLPKLILMAVLINFSKTICGLLIDAAQIVMLTFVNSFKDIVGANLTSALGIADWTTLRDTSTTGSGWEVAAVLVLAVIYVVIAITVVSAMLAMIAMRIVMIWIFVVLSPIAYLTAAFPGGKSYSSKWWSQFTQNLVVGPVLAFFIWLSFTSLTSFSSSQFMTDSNSVGKDTAISSSTGQFGTSNTMVKFVIAIGMLLGGMRIAKEIGGDAADAAGSIFQKGNSLAIGGAAALGFSAKGLKKLAMGDNLLARKVARGIGWDFRPVKLAESWKASTETSKRKDESAIQKRGREHYEKGGLRSIVFGTGAGEDYFNNYGSIKGIARAGKEVFYNQFARKGLSNNIDANEKEKKELEGNRERLLQVRQPAIDRQVEEDLSKDAEYNKQKLSNAALSRLAELKGKNKLSESEEKEATNLEGRNKKAEEIKETIRKKTEKEFLETDTAMVNIDAKIKVNDQELRRLKDEMNKVQAPVAFEARSSYRKAVEEAKAKYKSITNADDLQKAYTDAHQRGDKFDQVAILEKLSSDANLNEVLRTNGYSSNAKGLHAYTNNLENDFGEKKGLKGSFSDKERTEIENDLGESEERVGHWEMAKMCGVNSKGQMESYIKEMKDANGKVMKDSKGKTMYDDSQHAIAAYAELLKFDPQKVVNSMNRLAMGGEDGAGVFKVSNLGKMLFKYLATSDAYTKNEGRILGNTAANLMSGDNPKILEKVMEDEPEKFKLNIALMAKKGSNKDGSNLAQSQYDAVNKVNAKMNI